MKKPNLCLATILLTAAITSGTMLGLVNITSVLAQSSSNSQQETNATEKQPSSTTMVVGVGTVSFLASFVAASLYYKTRRSRRRGRGESKIDRYQEEFGCSPLAKFSQLKSLEASLSLTPDTMPSPKSVAEVPLTTISSKGRDRQTPSPKSDSTSRYKRYQALIEQIVEIILKGQIRSKEQVYQMLVENISIGTGEIFERCLHERFNTIGHQLNTHDELKLAKASRQEKALQTIRGVWEQWQKENQARSGCSDALQQILTSQDSEGFTTLLEVLDANQTHVFTKEQIKLLAKSLNEEASSKSEANLASQLQQLSSGLERGLESLAALEVYLVSWMYESPSQPGFEGPDRQGPWRLWAEHTKSELARQLFLVQELNEYATELVAQQWPADLSAWVELAVILQGLQRGLVTWFDKQPYDAKWGKRSSSVTFITFAIIWCQLSRGFTQAGHLSQGDRQQLAKACFQVTLQILRKFAQQENFPLYGGIFATFSGDYMKDAVKYLDEPLRQVEGTQEKSRILTLLGYSQRILGEYEQANSFHQEALEIARNAGDKHCEIANLNHLSRTGIAQKNYDKAINYSQRALILARQTGDRLGEANALANLGYSEVLVAQAREEMEPEVYQTSIEYLKQGLELSEKLGDFQSQAICYNSLGIAYLVLQQPAIAAEYLEKCNQAREWTGDSYLHAKNFGYLAEAYYSLNNLNKAIYYGCLGMYILERISTKEWRQAAGLLTIVQGKLGVEAFQNILRQYQAEIIAAIGVDGFDHLPQLLEQYKTST